MKMKMEFILLLLSIAISVCNGAIKSTTAEGRVINECLERFGGLTHENAERLQRYKTWSEQNEEIPCFTKCYISKMYDIYNETAGFNRENIIRKFNEPTYNACSSHMWTGRNSCEVAYNGFHCLVKLENDPLIQIDGIELLSDAARNAMRQCLLKFNDHDRQRLKQYSRFPVVEPLPCYTKCFMDSLGIYDMRYRQWRIDEMRRHLGVPKTFANIESCKALSRRRNRNSCAWMYQEFTCFVLSKEE